jgi:hypothetical protein
MRHLNTGEGLVSFWVKINPNENRSWLQEGMLPVFIVAIASSLLPVGAFVKNTGGIS